MTTASAGPEDFGKALARTLVHEGGFADHPNDPGGRTMKGVTQGTYDAFRRKHGLRTRDVRGITDRELQLIYRGIWVEARCPSIPWPLNALHFDAAVNHGDHQAALLLQRAVGADDDGIIGPRTLSAMDHVGAAEASRRQLMERLTLYVLLYRRPKLRVFMGGWCARLLDWWRFAEEEL